MSLNTAQTTAEMPVSWHLVKRRKVRFEREADLKMLLQIGDDVLLLGEIAPSQHCGYLRMPVSS